MDKQTTIFDATIEEMSKGYKYNSRSDSFQCLICGQVFEKGIIYPLKEQFLTAERRMSVHILEEHEGMFNYFLEFNKNYTALNDNQKQILKLLQMGYNDKDIADQLNVSASTVRNYKFKFREKVKQAKVFLALMSSMEMASKDMVQPHMTAKQIDERYNITEKDVKRTIETYFDANGHMATFPSKEKKKIICLRKIVDNFTHNKTYSEKEINRIIERIHDDYALIRRYLIEYGFLDRNKDGKTYWVK